RDTSNRLANALVAHGVGRGDRVAILLPQAPEVAAIHVAIYKLGAIALPLASLFGVDALSYRLQNAGVKALVCNAAGLAKLAPLPVAPGGPRPPPPPAPPPPRAPPFPRSPPRAPPPPPPRPRPRPTIPP